MVQTRGALIATAVVLGLTVVSTGAAAPAPSPAASMRWYRWRASSSELRERTRVLGATAVLGVVAMRQLAPLRARFGFRVVRRFPDLRAAAVTVTPALRFGAARERRIRYLSPLGATRQLAATPNDPLLSAIDQWTRLPYEWQFGAAHVDRALELSGGSPSVVVGTIDSGAGAVPDLSGKVDQRWTVSPDGRLAPDPSATDLRGHGTAVASLIAANVDDGFGMAGFGGSAHLVVVRVSSLTDVATAAALMKLDRLGVRIVNMSFGSDKRPTPIMLDAIHRSIADGMLLVAASGNSARAVAHPASDLQGAGGVVSYGLAVGASDVSGRPAPFSNGGAHLSLLAPGSYSGDCSGVLAAVAAAAVDSERSCDPTWAGSSGALYSYVSGTSFAAPEVAGVAALIWAARPELANYQVAGIIKQSADRAGGTWTAASGCGVLDAGAALELATGRSADEWAAAGWNPRAACR